MDDSSYLEDIAREFRRIKKQRRELRAAEYELTKQARDVAVRGLIAGLSTEQISAETGYSRNVVEKWEKSLKSVQKHKVLQEERLLRKAASRGRTSARQRSRVRRVRAAGQAPSWKSQVAPWMPKKRRR